MELELVDVLDLIPHPLAIVTAGGPETPDRRGGMTAAWISRVSWDPPLIAVSMAPTRYTYKLIKEFKAFAIHILSKKYEKIALEVFGALGGRNIDKFAVSGIEPVKAKNIVAPVIPDVPLVLECELVAEYVVGDHVIVIGRVVKGYKGSEDPPLVWLNSQTFEIGKQLKK